MFAIFWSFSRRWIVMSLSAADVDFHAVADGHVLGLGAADVGQVLGLVLGEQPDRAVGQRRQAQVLHARELLLLALLVQQLDVLEAVELGEPLAAVAVGELVDALQRHVGHLQGHQPLGLLVLDVLAALDGEEEVFGEALLDDLLAVLDLSVRATSNLVVHAPAVG